jgi:hypothetical protein
MVSALNESRHNALNFLVKAAAHSADCPNGFLVGGTSSNWELLASYGDEPQLLFEASTESWLKLTGYLYPE